MFLRNKFLCASVATFAFLATASASHAERKEPVEESREEKEKVDIQKVSEAFGHLISKNLESLGFEFDMKEVIKGLENSLAGKSSPMNEAECVQAISLVQEESFQKLAENNLKEADQFMTQNAKEEGIVEIEKSKLQYKVEKEGEGAVVEEHFSPLVRYSGRFLNGKVFGASQEDEMISLDETIAGFTQGIIGMKEGEKRTIYIHPEMGYGTSGYLPPNSALIFDIEVVKANVSPQEESSISTAPDEEMREIALPEGLEEEVLR